MTGSKVIYLSATAEVNIGLLIIIIIIFCIYTHVKLYKLCDISTNFTFCTLKFRLYSLKQSSLLKHFDFTECGHQHQHQQHNLRRYCKMAEGDQSVTKLECRHRIKTCLC